MKESKEARATRQRLEVEQFVKVLRDAGNVVETEFRFDMRPSDKTAEPPIPRRWRFDVVMPVCQVGRNPVPDAILLELLPMLHFAENIAIEIHGFGGGHQTTRAFKDDVEKLSEAFAQGWTVLVVTRQMIADGTALDVLARRGVMVSRSTSKEDCPNYDPYYGECRPIGVKCHPTT